MAQTGCTWDVEYITIMTSYIGKWSEPNVTGHSSSSSNFVEQIIGEGKYVRFGDLYKLPGQCLPTFAVTGRSSCGNFSGDEPTYHLVAIELGKFGVNVQVRWNLGFILERQNHQGEVKIVTNCSFEGKHKVRSNKMSPQCVSYHKLQFLNTTAHFSHFFLIMFQQLY